MNIAILGAMREEIEPILAKVGNYESHNYGNNIYYTCQYEGHNLVIAYSKIGKVFSSLSATIMIERFNAEVLLFSGVAGAINPSLKIGDLIMASSLVQHDVDITAFGHPYGFIPESSVMIESDVKLRAIAKNVASRLGVELDEGIIATGDQFVASSEKKDFIKDTFGADALEMEGASVASVCSNLGVPFFILRSISDSADGAAEVDFDTFLASSASVSANFILEMVRELGN